VAESFEDVIAFEQADFHIDSVNGIAYCQLRIAH
jgi:hypothetical protein